MLVGGGSKLRDIDAYARDQVELAVRLGKPEGILGVSEEVMKPEFATAVGLMMIDGMAADMKRGSDDGKKAKGGKKKKGEGGGFFARILKIFK